MVQPVPVGEVRMVPDSPTMTKRPFAKTMLLRNAVVPEVRRVQTKPSGELRIVPSPPTATQIPLPNASAFKILAAPEFRASHTSSASALVWEGDAQNERPAIAASKRCCDVFIVLCCVPGGPEQVGEELSLSS